MVSVKYIELSDDKVLKISLFNSNEFYNYHSILCGELSELEELLSYDKVIDRTEVMINPYLKPFNLMLTPFVFKNEAKKLFLWHLCYFNKVKVVDEIKKTYGYENMKYFMIEGIDKKELNGKPNAK